jgi:alpha-glucosidase
LPVNPNYAEGINIAGQQDDPDSLLNFYKGMLRLRRRTPALIAGEYTALLEDSEDCFAFLRTGGPIGAVEGQTCLVVLNMSDQAHELNLDLNTQSSKLLFSNHARDGDSDNLAQLSIAPFEIYIGELA